MFYVIGFPGMISYLLLAFKNLGFIENLTEKQISKYLNIWIRSPGIVINTYIIYQNLINGSFDHIGNLGKFAVLLSMGTTFWNGIYFASTITESYALHKKFVIE
jgi:hypothetical protein